MINSSTAIQKVSQNSGEYRLLLNRLHKATLDEAGTTFVRQALAEKQLLAQIDAAAMLQVAIIAQQHGLIAQGLAVYEQLNTRFPDCAEGWQQHLEILNLLGDRQAMVRIRARARRHFSEEQMKNWPGFLPPGESGVQAQADTDVTAPFVKLRTEEAQVRLFMDIFRGREDAFARQWVDRKEEKQGYVPVRHSLQPADIRNHLDGRRTYGIYLLDHNSMVHTGVIDMDLVRGLRNVNKAKKERAAIRRESLYIHKRIATLAREEGLCCLAEVSGGKGYHFWFPVTDAVPAAAMRRALLQLIGKLAEDVKCFTLEIFPKQDKLTGKGFGNLVKLPLGIHRGSGKPSSFVLAADRNRSSQFELLAQLRPTQPDIVLRLADLHKNAPILVHPRHASWAKEYPELAQLETNCSLLGQLIATLRSAKELSLREEKILLGTLGHLPRAGLLLHSLFAKLPEYNRALLDYKISRVRGTVLGCKRIHSLLERGGDLPCTFDGNGYPHPLRHLKNFNEEVEPKSERIENLQDALTCLKTAIRQVERFM
jgi:hypothetical protein